MKKIIYILTLFALCSLTVVSQTETKLTDGTGVEGDQFGYSVAISGNYAVVGIPYDDSSPIFLEDYGNVTFYALVGDSWIEVPAELPDFSQDELYFGYSVDIDGEYAIVSAPWYDGPDGDVEKLGAAFIYHLEGGSWACTDTLLANDGTEDDRFGINAAISGDYAIVGTFFDDPHGNRSGSAYVFKREGDDWEQIHKLIPDDGAEGDWFGVSVNMSNGYASVGSRYNDNDGGTNAGAVYVYQLEGETWSFMEKLIPWEDSDGVRFEKAAFSDDYVIVGANTDDSRAEDGGIVYIAEIDGSGISGFVQKYSDNISDNYKYGHTVAIDDNIMLIGAPNDSDTGAVYLYQMNNLGEEVRISTINGGADDKFGAVADIDGDHIIVGAYNNDEMGSNAGAAYIYDISDIFSGSSVTPVSEFQENVYDIQAGSYPNPFTDVTTITYELASSSHVTAEIYSMTGQKVKTLFNGQQTAGNKQIEWNGTSDAMVKLPAGYYFCKIKTSDSSQAFKIVINR
jgi:hypothetical protein